MLTFYDSNGESETEKTKNLNEKKLHNENEVNEMYKTSPLEETQSNTTEGSSKKNCYRFIGFAMKSNNLIVMFPRRRCLLLLLPFKNLL